MKICLLLFATILLVSLFPASAVTQTLHPLEHEETLTREIDLQEKKVFRTGKVIADNRFAGARLNEFEHLGNHHYRATIHPENTPVNMSPWYAFKLWTASDSLDIHLELDYQKPFYHRYFPKVSRDGKHWERLDSTHFEFPDSIHSEFTLTLSRDTLWVAAQEVISHSDVLEWCRLLDGTPGVNRGVYGKSVQGRELPYLDIYEGNPKGREVIILLTRQHPPEVTGFFAFQAFIHTLLDSNYLARNFRQKYRVIALPIMNPDGVDMGHWRHNAGGVDLNRDWGYYRQKETDVATSFLASTTRALENKIILGLDFHSTWSDIYYTLDNPPSQTLPEFWRYWTQGISMSIPGYNPRIDSSLEERDVSKNWFFRQFGAEGVTFEIGDNTDREFIDIKGRTAAASMMQLLIYRN